MMLKGNFCISCVFFKYLVKKGRVGNSSIKIVVGYIDFMEGIINIILFWEDRE